MAAKVYIITQNNEQNLHKKLGKSLNSGLKILIQKLGFCFHQGFAVPSTKSNDIVLYFHQLTNQLTSQTSWPYLEYFQKRNDEEIGSYLEVWSKFQQSKNYWYQGDLCQSLWVPFFEPLTHFRATLIISFFLLDCFSQEALNLQIPAKIELKILFYLVTLVLVQQLKFFQIRLGFYLLADSALHSALSGVIQIFLGFNRCMNIFCVILLDGTKIFFKQLPFKRSLVQKITFFTLLINISSFLL